MLVIKNSKIMNKLTKALYNQIKQILIDTSSKSNPITGFSCCCIERNRKVKLLMIEWKWKHDFTKCNGYNIRLKEYIIQTTR